MLKIPIFFEFHLRPSGRTRAGWRALLVSLSCGACFDILFPLLAVGADTVVRAVWTLLLRLLLLVLLVFEGRALSLLRAVGLLHMRMVTTRMTTRAHYAVHQIVIVTLLRPLGGGRSSATPHNHTSSARHSLFIIERWRMCYNRI